MSFRKIVEMYWFGGIVCVGKDASKYGYNDKYEIVEFKGDHSTPAGTAGTGDKNYWAWHPSNKLSAHVVSDLTAGGNDNQCYMFVWDEAVYSKYYRRFPSSGGYHTTVVGDKLKASTRVSFNSKD